jgi:hypothetical protein
MYLSYAGNIWREPDSSDLQPEHCAVSSTGVADEIKTINTPRAQVPLRRPIANRIMRSLIACSSMSQCDELLSSAA